MISDYGSDSVGEKDKMADDGRGGGGSGGGTKAAARRVETFVRRMIKEARRFLWEDQLEL